MSTDQPTRLVRHIGPAQGVALYVSAVLGAGVLVLPGQLASAAGPASLLSWVFACAMGVPLAWMFAALARRHPDAGGVATYVGRAFGPALGGVTGWLYFVAGAVGQTIVPLTGGYYVADALGLGAGAGLAVAAVILAAAVAANLAGVGVSGHAQLALAAGVATALVVAITVAAPRMSLDRLTPFAPHGLAPAAAGVVVLFFAFAGWEAVAHLSGEFRDPDRDLPRAVAATVAVVTVLYLGIAGAVVLTGTYGSPGVDHVAIGLLLQGAFGGAAAPAAAVVAVVISLGTTNAFVAGVSRLGHSLAEDGWLPGPVARVRRDGVPVGGVLAVGLVAAAGLALAAALGWGTETLVVAPSTLVVAVYLLAAAAGVRLQPALAARRVPPPARRASHGLRAAPPPGTSPRGAAQRRADGRDDGDPRRPAERVRARRSVRGRLPADLRGVAVGHAAARARHESGLTPAPGEPVACPCRDPRGAPPTGTTASERVGQR